MVEPEPEAQVEQNPVPAAPPCRADKTQKHMFLSKTVRFPTDMNTTQNHQVQFLSVSLSDLLQVIRPETCLPCGKRIRFGKMAVKCRNCRVVAHPECKHSFTTDCLTSNTGGAAHMVRQAHQAWGVLDHNRDQTPCVCPSPGLIGGFCSTDASQSSSSCHAVCV